MRNIIATCMSVGAARIRVARVLDAYLWRIGDATWRGRASSACLKRMSVELRRKASRNTAVAIHEAKNGSPYRDPILTIGRRDAFGPRGTVPVSTRARPSRREEPAGIKRARSVLAIAAFFHDFGKAGMMFQNKINQCVAGRDAKIADKARHELISFAVWDILFGGLNDEDLCEALLAVTPADIDAAWDTARRKRNDYFSDVITSRPGRCLSKPGLSRTIGLLILTHHRLPGSRDHANLTAERHSYQKPDMNELKLFPGTPFWHGGQALDRFRSAAERLTPGPVGMADFMLRTCLMAGDHYGSSIKEKSESRPEHVANSLDNGYADDLGTHTLKVMKGADDAFQALIADASSLPSVSTRDIPEALLDPPSEGVYGWQGRAAACAAELSATGGGFFACLIAGTGTGKTFGIPTILSASVMADPDPDRRSLRFTLGLGLRTLASQSARSYVEDVKFRATHVREAIGAAPLEFPDRDAEGSESLEAFEDLASAPAQVAETDDLSWSPDDDLPALLTRIINKRAPLDLIRAPVVAGTIDQIMSSVRPIRSSHLTASIRVMTSDLVIDEIDQLGPEDLVPLYTLIRQSAAAGRRVIIASATLPPDIADAAFSAYRAGWQDHARLRGVDEKVSTLVAGDAPGAIFSDPDCSDISGLYGRCAQAQVDAAAPGRIVTHVMSQVSGWSEIVAAVSGACDRAHDENAVGGISAGLIRVGRISNTIGLAHALAQTESASGAQRAIVVLHSRMTRAARSLIEYELRRALDRKRSAEGGVREFLARHGLSESENVQLIVVSSPVIETGNDLDFDYAIIDPTDSRSVIQTAGRVRRHRRDAAPGANLIFMPAPLQISSGETELAFPGPESTPAEATRIPRRDLGAARRDVRELLGDLITDADPRHIIMRTPGACLSADEEAALRSAMVDGHDDSNDVLRSGVGRLDRRIFRRRTRPSTDIRRADDSTWHVLRIKHVPVSLARVKSDVPVQDSVLIKDPHSAAIQLWQASGITIPENASVVSVPVDENVSNPRSFSDHPVYGVIMSSHDPESPFGKAEVGA